MFFDRLIRRRIDQRYHRRMLTQRTGPSGCPTGRRIERPRRWRPQVRRLENRIALNASAELNPLGQLIITGMGQDDFVEVDRISDDRLILRDPLGDVIPIANHPLGVGFESTAIRLDDIVSSQIRIDLGGGDDSVRLGPMDGFDVFVVENPGEDISQIRLSGSQVLQSGSLTIASEQITLTSPSGLMNLGGVSTRLVGDVTIEENMSVSRLLVDQRLSVEGRLTLADSLQIQGTGRIDFSEADLSAIESGTTLTIHQEGAEVLLGDFGDLGGALVESLRIDSASTVVADGDLMDLNGDLSILGINQSVRIDSVVNADSIFISATDQVCLKTDLLATGSIDLRADQLVVEGQLLTPLGLPTSVIRLESASNLIIDSTLATDQLTGVIAGDLSISGLDSSLESVSDLNVSGDLILNDSIGDLRLQSVFIGGEIAQVTTVGVLGICDVDAANASVVLQADRVIAQRDGCGGNAADLRSGALRIDVQMGIGLGSPVDLEIADSVRAISQSGNIRLNLLPFDQGYPESITIERVSTRDGDIELVANQTLVVDSGRIEVSSLNPAVSHEMVLRAIGEASDLIVGEIEVADGFDVRLHAGDDVLGGSLFQTANVVADDLIVIAGNELADQSDSIRLVTQVNDLEAEVRGDNRGDLLISEVDSIRLASSDSNLDSIIRTGNGQIVITANGSIEVVDREDRSELDRKGDPEIHARGLSNGRVALTAPELKLDDGVQIHAEKQIRSLPDAVAQRPLREPDSQGDANAIHLQTDRFEVGQDVELFTGTDQGTARVFADRPNHESLGIASPGSSAYFDPRSITVNVLTQALENDATGILTFDIGAPGEKGMTVTIDWGDSNDRRLQQIDGLDADEPYFVGFDLSRDLPRSPIVSNSALTHTGQAALQVEHLYLQEDVLDSTENGRNSATDPFQVRFAVRHHESIVVESLSGQSATVLQDLGDGVVAQNEVTGGVVSSTDNPNTRTPEVPILESGQAAFIVPALTIPVAFIPVRDVIPDFETIELRVSSDLQNETANATVEESGTTVVTTVSHKEHFQLRVRSSDPDGEDLIEPPRLPDEIMEGTRLQEFLRSLPDASYEIEYVIGDGNERSILQFDVRSGEPIIREGALDEGELRLIELDAKEGHQDLDVNDNDLKDDVDSVHDVKDDLEGKRGDEQDARSKSRDESSGKDSSRFSRATRFARLRHADR